MITKQSRHTGRNPALAEALTELVMSLLPIVVVFLVMLELGQPYKVFAKPELAFGAAILFGQSLVRLLAGMANPHRKVQQAKVVLFAAVVIVLGLVPTLLCLVFLIHGAEQSASVSVGYMILQAVLFVLSAVVFVVVSIVTHELSSRSEVGQARLNSDVNSN
jgi:hypothetical protein